MNIALQTLAAGDPLGHVIDKPLLFGGAISNVTVMLVVSAVVTYMIMKRAAEKIQTGNTRSLEDFQTQGIMANIVEVICLYLRNDVFKEALKDKTDKYTPFLWTFFWYILINNLLGLIPFLDTTAAINALVSTLFGTDKFMYAGSYLGIGGTATQSIWVTGTLALIAAAFFIGAAIADDWKSFLMHLTGGTPVFMWPIMVPVEIMGLIIKPFALAVRLFANMTAGHLVIAVLLSFVNSSIQALGLGAGSLGVSAISVLGATAINVLEIMVAVLQAYIFTYLTTLALASFVVHEHHDDHDHEHEHAHAH